MKNAIGKFNDGINKNGEQKTPYISVMVQSNSKKHEIAIEKELKTRGFKAGTPFKNNQKKVVIPGTFWLNKSVMGNKEINPDVAKALNGKMVVFENGYLKKADKAHYQTYNHKTEKNSTVFNVVEVEVEKNGEKTKKLVVRISGNLKAVKKGDKINFFISNSTELITKDGEKWKEETINEHQEKLKAYGFYTKVTEHEGKYYLNITKNIYAASTSILSEEKLAEIVMKNSPFVIVEIDLYKYLEGGAVVIDKNNKITPLGETSQKTFKGYKDKMTIIEKHESEDLYADTGSEEEEIEENEEEIVY